MIKVNLISKKSRAYKGRNWTRTIVWALFGLVVSYFVGVTLYVVISLSVMNAKIKRINEQSSSISSVMLANNEKLSRFVLTKLILSKIEGIDKERFHYKDYLDQVSLLLPNGSLLSSVGFTTKGWIAVTVNSDNINSFKLLEETLMNKNTWVDNKFFSGAYIEKVSKDKSGAYSTSLQFQLNKING